MQFCSRTRSLLLLGAVALGSHLLSAAGTDSTFSTTTYDIQVASASPAVLLSSTIYFPTTRYVLPIADGRYYPYMYAGIAVVSIRIDGSEVYSSKARMDFRSNTGVQHSFNVIAPATLGPGNHTFELIAYNDSSTPSARFYIGAYSGLSVMTDPAPNMQANSTWADSATMNFTTGNLPITTVDGFPTSELLGYQVSTASTPVLTLASGSSYLDGNPGGDAAWRIYVNGAPGSNTDGTWSANDVSVNGDLSAPMFAHAMQTLTGTNTISLRLTELILSPENPASYRVSANARLVSLWGMQVAEKSYCSNTRTDAYQYDWASASELPTTTFTLPAGHNGVVLFLAKSRVQGDPADVGGNASMRLRLDGVDVGTVAVQELKYPHSESTRTLSASYLAAGANRLAPGTHTIQVIGQISGSFAHLAFTKDVPLIIID